MTLQEVSKSYYLAHSIPLDVIEKYIPARKGTRSAHAFRILNAIHNKPKTTIRGVQHLFRTQGDSIKIAIAYLLELGLVEKVDKPHYVIALNTWRHDKAYISTKRGENIIKNVLFSMEFDT
jgi:hypothetical protein